jgi:hypothetical protein
MFPACPALASGGWLQRISRTRLTASYLGVAPTRTWLIVPEFGASVKGGGGYTKATLLYAGAWKSSGIRVIYYWAKTQYQIYMLVACPKSRKDTLTDRETATLRELVKEL